MSQGPDSTIFDIYRRLPILLQHAAVSLQGARIERGRYGSGFREMLKRIRGREYWDVEKLHSLQAQRLQTLIESAVHSPFWKEQFEENNVDVSGADPFEELKKLPLLTKETVKSNTEDILSRQYRRSELNDSHTSGTTGSGLQFWKLSRTEQEQFAVWWRYREWHRLNRTTWHGYFGGRQVVKVEQEDPPYWRFNFPGRQVLFSNYHLSPDTAPGYARAINKCRLKWLHGYPSALALFGQFVLEQELGPFDHIEIVTTGAENLLPSQRRTIADAFGCEVREHYGLAEGVANISECPEGHLHVDEDFALVEFVPIKESEGEKKAHRIIGTNFANPAFPLFRYDTGDIAYLHSGSSCSCDRTGRLVSSLHGRKEDYVVLPSGARIGRLDHIFKDLVAVREAQIYQPDTQRVVFRVVPGEEYDKRKTEERLIKEARKRLGESITIDVEYRKQIPRTDSGKVKFVVSGVESMKIEEYR
jgi:phenylacetate-CoA ligase